MEINDLALEKLLSEYHFFSQSEFTEEHQRVINEERNKFRETFTKDFVKKAKEEDYFQGLGKKKGCLTYELEWGTKKLGSIRGGSVYKFGYREDFPKIKKLLLKLLEFHDLVEEFYNKDGSLTNKAKKICSLSKEIKGLKIGRTTIGKLLSIYYPKTFIPLFTDQDYFLSKLVRNFMPEAKGLELFLKNNFMLLTIKEKLIEKLPDDFLSNDKFVRLLYYCFKRNENKELEENVEALETEHYQTLIHRNFKKLFPKWKYFDSEHQDSKKGHYDTQEVGVMDFLCLDDENNFVVIELKRKASDQTIGQLCRYMGWVQENLCKDSQIVKGLILAENLDTKLEYALKMVPNVKIRKMKLDITISDFDLLD